MFYYPYLLLKALLDHQSLFCRYPPFSNNSIQTKRRRKRRSRDPSAKEIMSNHFGRNIWHPPWGPSKIVPIPKSYGNHTHRNGHCNNKATKTSTWRSLDRGSKPICLQCWGICRHKYQTCVDTTLKRSPPFDNLSWRLEDETLICAKA